MNYVRQHGYTVVVGSKPEAVIDEREALALPRANDAAHPELEALVQQVGVWNELSLLSVDKLRRAIEENVLPEPR